MQCNQMVFCVFFGVLHNGGNTNLSILKGSVFLYLLRVVNRYWYDTDTELYIDHIPPIVVNERNEDVTTLNLHPEPLNTRCSLEGRNFI